MENVLMKLGNLLSFVVSYSELRISFSSSEVEDSEFTNSIVHLFRSELVQYPELASWQDFGVWVEHPF